MKNHPCIINAGESEESSACIKQNDSSLSTEKSAIIKQLGTFHVAKESNYANLLLM
jgi:hypothetical protein